MSHIFGWWKRIFRRKKHGHCHWLLLNKSFPSRLNTHPATSWLTPHVPRRQTVRHGHLSKRQRPPGHLGMPRCAGPCRFSRGRMVVDGWLRMKGASIVSVCDYLEDSRKWSKRDWCDQNGGLLMKMTPAAISLSGAVGISQETKHLSFTRSFCISWDFNCFGRCLFLLGAIKTLHQLGSPGRQIPRIADFVSLQQGRPGNDTSSPLRLEKVQQDFDGNDFFMGEINWFLTSKVSKEDLSKITQKSSKKHLILPQILCKRCIFKNPP